MATQQVWITLQAVFWLQIFVEGKIHKMKLFCFWSLFVIKKGDTSCACSTNKRSIPVVLSRNLPWASNASGWNSSKLVTDLNRAHDHTKKINEYGVSLLLANTMSFAPKIDEVKCVISDVNPDLASFTETWPRDSISENYLHIPGYHFAARNRTTDLHGGVGLYIKNKIKFKSLDYLNDPDCETMSTWLQPTGLPRGITCLIAGTVYHSQTVNDMAILNHLETTLTSIEGKREWSEGSNPSHMTLFSWKLFSIYLWFCVIRRGYFKDSTSLVC